MEQQPGQNPPEGSSSPPPPPPPPPSGRNAGGETGVGGLAPNVAGALAYFLGPITGILFLVLEKENRFVRFHAAQSVGLSVAWIAFWIVTSVLSAALAVVPVVGFLVSILMLFVSLILGLGGLVFWLYLMYQAFSGNEWEIPYIGEQSRKVLLGG